MFEVGSHFPCSVMNSIGRRPLLQVDQSTHQLWFGIPGMEEHYERFRNKNKIINEAVLDVE